MIIKKNFKIFFIIFLFLFLIIFTYIKLFKKENNPKSESSISEDIIYKSNIIENVNYITKDADGNEYIINSRQGEIDFSDPNIIYLKDVRALIKLNMSEEISIISDFGKYNTNNFDTIFSKNVIIKYLENKIVGDYVDFSMERNSMIISKDVIYSNLENIMKADVIEMNIKTKDTKIFMYEENKKVNIRSKN
tara:strand:- start:1626 stop:2201 length:576 start_codon:yes stop_codon:yes gene_type:complete